LFNYAKLSPSHLDGFFGIDLKHLVPAKGVVKAGRSIKIHDALGQPFVLDLVSKKKEKGRILSTTVFLEQRSVAHLWIDALGFGGSFEAWILFQFISTMSQEWRRS
jgi:hypothetical protein